MPYNWTSEAHFKMFLYVVAKSDFKPEGHLFEGVADMLGEGLNSNACNQRFYKLKREADKLLGGGNDESAGPSTPSAKPTTPKTPRTKSTGGGNKRKNADDDDLDTGADVTANGDAGETPSKPKRSRKRQPKKAKTETKDEADTKVKTDGDNEDSKDQMMKEANGVEHDAAMETANGDNEGA